VGHLEGVAQLGYLLTAPAPFVAKLLALEPGHLPSPWCPRAETAGDDLRLDLAAAEEGWTRLSPRAH